MTTFTVTAEPAHIPPRVRIDLDTEDPLKRFSKIAVRRGGQLIRSQPTADAQVAVVYDYDAPFGVVSHYTVEATIAAVATTLSESWASLSGWTTTAGTPGVTSSRFRTTDTNRATVERAISLPSAGRLEVLPGASNFYDDGTVDSGAHGGMVILGAGSPDGVGGITPVDGSFAIRRNPRTDPAWILDTNDVLEAARLAVVPGEGVSVAWDDQGRLTFATSAKTLIHVARFAPLTAKVGVSTTPGTQIGAFKVENYTAPTTFTASQSVELDVAEVWLIHPIYPALSCSVDDGTGARLDAINVDIGTAQSTSFGQNAETFEPIGRPRKVVVSSGDRSDGEWELVLLTQRLADRDRIRNLVTDQSPLLLRVPPDIDIDLPDGWYSVGEVTVTRGVSALQRGWRRTSLPLTPVDEPVLAQGAQWSWASVLANYDTWADVLDEYPTWLDLVVGP